MCLCTTSAVPFTWTRFFAGYKDLAVGRKQLHFWAFTQAKSLWLESLCRSCVVPPPHSRCVNAGHFQLPQSDMAHLPLATVWYVHLKMLTQSALTSTAAILEVNAHFYLLQVRRRP